MKNKYTMFSDVYGRSHEFEEGSEEWEFYLINKEHLTLNEVIKSCRTCSLYVAHYDGKRSKMECAYDRKTIKDCKDNNFRLHAFNYNNSIDDDEETK